MCPAGGSPSGDDSSASRESATSQRLGAKLSPGRRGSVSFSDIVVELRGDDTSFNVCCNEKMTQTEGSLSSVVLAVSSVNEMATQLPPPHRTKSCLHGRTRDGHGAAYSASGSGSVPLSPGLTCQELLALSGALGAALPTPLALPNQNVQRFNVAHEASGVQAGPGVGTTATAASTTGAAVGSATISANDQLQPMPAKNNKNSPLNSATILPSLALALWPEAIPSWSSFFYLFPLLISSINLVVFVLDKGQE